MPTGLNPGISVGVLDNLVWDFLDIPLALGVCEFSADQTFGGEESVFWVDDCLPFG